MLYVVCRISCHLFVLPFSFESCSGVRSPGASHSCRGKSQSRRQFCFWHKEFHTFPEPIIGGRSRPAASCVTLAGTAASRFASLPGVRSLRACVAPHNDRKLWACVVVFFSCKGEIMCIFFQLLFWTMNLDGSCHKGLI